MNFGLTPHLSVNNIPQQLPNVVKNREFSNKVRTVRNAQINPGLSRNLTTTWVFIRPMPDLVIKHIVKAHINNKTSVHVYCGTMECLKTVQELKRPVITASFLVVPNVLARTPLKEWGQRHLLNKILTGLHYEWYLTQALCFAHLWKYGRTFCLPSFKTIIRIINNETRSMSLQGDCLCASLEYVVDNNIAFSNISPRDERVKKQIAKFLRKMDSWKSGNLSALQKIMCKSTHVFV